MKYAKTTTWIGGAVFLAIVLAGFAWFFAISPVLDEASANSELAERTNAENEILAATNVRLAKQFEDLDEYKAELAEYRTRIQETIDQADFNRELAKLSDDSKAFVVDVTFATSIELGSETGAPRGLFAIPVTVTVLGSPDETRNYLKRLQQKTDRLFYVSAITAAGQDEAGATGGRPATAAGDLEISITGYIYTLNAEKATQVEQVPAPDGESAEGEDSSEEPQAT